MEVSFTHQLTSGPDVLDPSVTSRRRRTHLVFAHAPLLGELGARRTRVLAVARVAHGVFARMRARAQLATLGRARAARHGREEHLEAAAAPQLVKTCE